MLVLIPMLNLKVHCLCTADDVNDSEIRTYFYFNVALVIERWKNEAALSFYQEVNIFNLSSFIVQKFINFERLWFEKRAHP